jgi:hypothetical protein
MNSTALTLAENTALAIGTGAEDAEHGACFMANEYAEATAEVLRLMNAIDEQTARLAAVFGESYGFRVEFHYDGSTYYRHDENSYGKIFEKMQRRAWRALLDRLGVKNVMSIAKRKQFEDQLERGELPELTADAIVGVIAGLAGDAKEFARDAAKEVFDMLTPKHGWGGGNRHRKGKHDRHRKGKRRR